jgi:DNA-binding transcriptional MocR family regulator
MLRIGPLQDVRTAQFLLFLAASVALRALSHCQTVVFQLDVRLTAPGLHVSAGLPDPMKAGNLVIRAADRRLRFASLDRFAARANCRCTGVVFGFGLVQPEEIRPAVELLKDVMTSTDP